MAGFKKGSKEHLDKLVEIIAESCKKLNDRSEENENDTKKILDAFTTIYVDYASRWAAMNDNRK